MQLAPGIVSHVACEVRESMAVTVSVEQDLSLAFVGETMEALHREDDLSRTVVVVFGRSGLVPADLDLEIQRFGACQSGERFLSASL